MKKIFTILTSTIFSLYNIALGFTGDIEKKTFMIDVDSFFPTWSGKAADASEKGINNISELILSLIPMITTMMAIGATIMVVWGGFRMILGGASAENTEAGKGIIKDAIIGLIMGLLAYVIIAFLGNILNI